MKHYLESIEEVLKETNSCEQGLDEVAANERLEKYGKNKLKEGKKESIFIKFLKQFTDPMTIVLIVAAILSAVTAIYGGESLADVFIILGVVILNAILGVVQESKAEEAITALKNMTSPSSKVIRNNKLQIIKSEDIVIGDIVALEAGDQVPADGRIIECASLKVEEAALTGESVPTNKSTESLNGENVSLGDRKNMAYMGCTVVYGRGKMVVTSTGMDTEMGKIATALSNAKDEATPLQKKLSGLSKILTFLVLGICVVMFIVGIVKAGEFNLNVALDTFMLAVSLAVAAIPEGLATVVTIVLSIGVTKMSKRNAVIRKLTAVETLGCAQVICSDKTGTLTQNKMTVVKEYTDNGLMLARIMSLCNDSEYDKKKKEAVGEPTECALVNYANKLGVLKDELKSKYPRVGEAPFDSSRKMMSTIHKVDDLFEQYTKGAPDEVLKNCQYILKNDGIKPLSEDDIKEIKNKNKEMADSALRVLAGAFKVYNNFPESMDAEKIENELVFVGLYGMIDPIRPEVKVAADLCKEAGIKVVMITGDHIDTAKAIAKELGIIQNDSEAITGSDLDKIPDEELIKRINEFSVYARVQPEHKVRIVNAWKKIGKVTAMTGDGVNDAPSIKSADIGIGMGITGTDVTKNVADMILADDNFATIVSAVDEGRKIYTNIRKSIQFLLSSNLSEVIAVFVSTMLGFVILKPVHILWINLITDSLPALALGMEPSEDDSMKQKPRDPKDGIFAGGVGFDILYQGFLVAMLTIVAYLIGHYIETKTFSLTTSADGISMAFLTLSIAEICHAFNVRRQRKSLLNVKKQNLYLWGAGLIALILTTVVIYVPFIRELFGFEYISLMEYGIALLLGFSIIPIVEIIKFFQRLKKSK